MTDAPERRPDAILEHSAKLRLFVALRHTRDPEALKARLADHLRWMGEQEKAGGIFLSGPMTGGSRPDGLTVLRTADIAAAEALIRTDPLVAAGIVAVEVREWTANEGRLTLTVTLSDTRGALT